MADLQNGPITPIFGVFTWGFLYEEFLKYLLNHISHVFLNFNR